MPDDKAIHLGMIQVVITRMGANSFVIKGWNVTLASALLALSVKDGTPRFVLVAFLPAIVFWILDAYYLRQERLFRKLYEEAAEPKTTVPLFQWLLASMKTRLIASVPQCCRPPLVFYTELSSQASSLSCTL